MIITQEALLAVNGCPIIVQHLIDKGYEGLTRLQFVQKLQEDADAGLHDQWWVSWGKTYLYNGDAIVKLGEFVKTQRYDINGMNIPEGLQIFTDLQEAILAIKKLQAEQIASEEWMFHVHAKCPEGQDAHTLHNCDLDGDGVFDHEVECYQAFNHSTGEYECFDKFEEARVRCDEMKFERFNAVCASYNVTEEVQQINDPEENPTGWVTVDLGNRLAFDLTLYQLNRQNELLSTIAKE